MILQGGQQGQSSYWSVAMHEGIDELVINADIDRDVYLGDFVYRGGEVPALAVIDGVTRLLPGAVGDSNSVAQDSFSDGLLDYPQFTRPKEIAGKRVPDVLLSGNHQIIARWRQKQALGKTWEKRPDLIRDRTLTKIERQLLDDYRSETES